MNFCCRFIVSTFELDTVLWFPKLLFLTAWHELCTKHNWIFIIRKWSMATCCKKKFPAIRKGSNWKEVDIHMWLSIWKDLNNKWQRRNLCKDCKNFEKSFGISHRACFFVNGSWQIQSYTFVPDICILTLFGSRYFM